MLKIHFRDNRQAPIWLVDERFTIGQDSRNSLVLADDGISAFHAEIRQEQGFYYLSDCGSQLGTFANNERITSRYQLRAGDLVRLAGVELQLADTSKPANNAESAAKRWFLQVMKGEHEGRKFHITGSMTFGRSEKCELCFSDAELSRRHCEFFLKNDILEVKDLASANGVLVNGQKVSTAVLQPGDELKMGSVSFLVIGPKIAVPQAREEAATVFVPVAKLPPVQEVPSRVERPQVEAARAAPPSVAAAPAERSNRLVIVGLATVLVAAAAVAAITLL